VAAVGDAADFEFVDGTVVDESEFRHG
jgi:hypothetical protein